MVQKVCNTCNISKELDKYHINKAGKDGRHNICKSCRSSKRKNLNYNQSKTGEKFCTSCKQKKSFKDFAKDKGSTDGCQTYCKKCKNKFIKEYCNTLDGYIKKIFRDMKNIADRKDVEVNIDIKHIENLWQEQDGKCALSGEKMTHISYKTNTILTNNYNASIDLIDSTRGYTHDNIQLVSSIVNTVKCDMEMKQFIEMCRKVANFNF